MTIIFSGNPKPEDEDAAAAMKSRAEFADLQFSELWANFSYKSIKLRKQQDKLDRKFAIQNAKLKGIYQTAKYWQSASCIL